MGEVDQEPDHRKFLELCGYGGEWFDCRDVEGYLREQGVDLDASSLFPSIHDQRIRHISQLDGDIHTYQSINDYVSQTHEGIARADVTRAMALTLYRY